MEESKRAANYRERAQTLGRAAKTMPPEEQRTALLHQKALQDLADIEDWITAEPRPAGTKHDYNLTPRVKAGLVSRMFKPRGRAVGQPEQSRAATASDANIGHVASIPHCPDCNFAMTPVSRDGTANVRLPEPVFECRACGIMVMAN